MKFISFTCVHYFRITSNALDLPRPTIEITKLTAGTRVRAGEARPEDEAVDAGPAGEEHKGEGDCHRDTEAQPDHVWGVGRDGVRLKVKN